MTGAKQNVSCPVCHGTTKKADNVLYVGGGIVHICTDANCSTSAPAFKA